MRRLGILGLVLAGCNNDIGVAATARCDGVAQASEKDRVDGAFDADGDGYFDGSNPDCQATYDASRLDCNDAVATVNPGANEEVCNDLDDDCNPDTIDAGDAEIECNDLDDDCDPGTPDALDQDADGYTTCDDCADLTPNVNPGAVETVCNSINDDCNDATPDELDEDGDGFGTCDDCDDAEPLAYPGFEEICGDGIDNDCSGGVDDTCTYDGRYQLDQEVSYSCAWGLVSFRFDTVTVVDSYPSIRVTAGGSTPGNMSGSFTSATAFDADNTLSGTCDEIYSITGEFSSLTEFDAEMSVQFVGSCYDCYDQSWTVHGIR